MVGLELCILQMSRSLCVNVSICIAIKMFFHSHLWMSTHMVDVFGVVVENDKMFVKTNFSQTSQIPVSIFRLFLDFVRIENCTFCKVETETNTLFHLSQFPPPTFPPGSSLTCFVCLLSSFSRGKKIWMTSHLHLHAHLHTFSSFSLFPEKIFFLSWVSLCPFHIQPTSTFAFLKLSLSHTHIHAHTRIFPYP